MLVKQFHLRVEASFFSRVENLEISSSYRQLGYSLMISKHAHHCQSVTKAILKALVVTAHTQTVCRFKKFVWSRISVTRFNLDSSSLNIDAA